jgi:hypothetical protein
MLNTDSKLALDLAQMKIDFRKLTDGRNGSTAYDFAVKRVIRDLNSVIVNCTGGMPPKEQKRRHTPDKEERQHAAWIERQYNPLHNKLGGR